MGLPNNQHAVRLVCYWQLFLSLPASHSITGITWTSGNRRHHPGRCLRIRLPGNPSLLLHPLDGEPTYRLEEVLSHDGHFLVTSHVLADLCLHFLDGQVDSDRGLTEGFQFLNDLQ